MDMRPGSNAVTKSVVAVGLSGDAARLNRFKRVVGGAGLVPVLLDDWTTASVTASPSTLRFDLRLAHGLTVGSESIARVLFFERPKAPDVADANRAYQSAEFEGLLFTLLFIASPDLTQRWSYATAGFSETELSFKNDVGHPVLSRDMLATCFQFGSGEAWVSGNLIVHRSHAGELAQAYSTSACVNTDVTVELDAARGIYVPWIGRIPAWVAEYDDLLEHAISTKRSQTPWEDASRSPWNSVAECHRELTIVAHSSDTTASHLFYRALARRVKTDFIDLRYMLSPACPLEQYERLLERIQAAPLLYTRPLPSRVVEFSRAELPRRRYGQILRTVQSREAMTMNRPAAGYTNLSKGAHVALFRMLGLRVPPTLVTTDADAVLAFARECGATIYKSGSHARSIATHLTAADEMRLATLTKCPALFQKQVTGSDYRVHTVFERAITVQIGGSALDYRFSGSASYRAVSLPQDETDVLVAAARASGLILSGADIRRSDEDGESYLLEINRMPAFDFFDHRGSGVADAILDLVVT